MNLITTRTKKKIKREWQNKSEKGGSPEEGTIHNHILQLVRPTPFLICVKPLLRKSLHNKTNFNKCEFTENHFRFTCQRVKTCEDVFE